MKSVSELLAADGSHENWIPLMEVNVADIKWRLGHFEGARRQRATSLFAGIAGRLPSCPALSIWLSIWRTASPMLNNAVVISGVKVSCRSRRRLSRFSPTCATASSLSKPRKPHVPLMV
jgi:hypothetical protein